MSDEHLTPREREIAEREQKATPGPWKWREHDTDEYTCLDSDKSLVIDLKELYGNLISRTFSTSS